MSEPEVLFLIERKNKNRGPWLLHSDKHWTSLRDVIEEVNFENVSDCIFEYRAVAFQNIGVVDPSSKYGLKTVAANRPEIVQCDPEVSRLEAK